MKTASHGTPCRRPTLPLAHLRHILPVLGTVILVLWKPASKHPICGTFGNDSEELMDQGKRRKVAGEERHELIEVSDDLLVQDHGLAIADSPCTIRWPTPPMKRLRGGA